ncbi:hypothetical protein EON65_19795 [archaeon]|nr:MAG: hypothetical protein EON65_19795 [archaeon]
MMHAAQAGEVRTVQLLLQYGANPHIINQVRVCVLYHSIPSSLFSCTQLYLRCYLITWNGIYHASPLVWTNCAATSKH